MKYAIRAKMFETNSSSVHAIVVLSEDQYNTWKQNQLYLKLPEPPNVPYNLGEVEIEGMWTLEQVDNLIYEETKNEQFGYLTQDDPNRFFGFNFIPYDADEKQEYQTNLYNYAVQQRNIGNGIEYVLEMDFGE